MTDETDRPQAIDADDPRNKLAAGLFFAAWAVAGWISLSANDQIAGVDFGLDPGPGLLPTIVLSILTAGAAALCGSGLAGLRRRSARPPVPWSGMAREAALPLLLLACLAGYVPLVRLVGFLPGTALFAIGWMALLDRAGLRAAPRPALVAIALGSAIGVGLIYALFIRWIGVPLR